MTRPKMGTAPTLPPAGQRTQPDAADHFVSAARSKETAPWHEPAVRTDLTLAMHMRMPETLILKVEWLALRTDRTRRAIVEEALENYTAAEVRKYGYEP